jgi:hypothetical protein
MAGSVSACSQDSSLVPWSLPGDPNASNTSTQQQQLVPGCEGQ